MKTINQDLEVLDAAIAERQKQSGLSLSPLTEDQILEVAKSLHEFFWAAKAAAACFVFFLVLSSTAFAQAGIATWYSHQSTLDEGNSGITASGEKMNDKAFTCALRSYEFGKRYQVTNTENGKKIICRHNDFGPGRGPLKRGVIVDLSPAAYDALGAKRGITKSGAAYGEIPIHILEVKS